MMQLQCYGTNCEVVYKTWSRDGWNIYCKDCKRKEVEKVMQIFDDIMPCPWCGSKLLVEEKVGFLKPNGIQIAVVCLDCNAKGPTIYTNSCAKTEVIKAIWNERK